MIIAHLFLLPVPSLFAADWLAFVVGCAFACADERPPSSLYTRRRTFERLSR